MCFYSYGHASFLSEWDVWFQKKLRCWVDGEGRYENWGWRGSIARRGNLRKIPFLSPPEKKSQYHQVLLRSLGEVVPLFLVFFCIVFFFRPENPCLIVMTDVLANQDTAWISGIQHLTAPERWPEFLLDLKEFLSRDDTLCLCIFAARTHAIIRFGVKETRMQPTKSMISRYDMVCLCLLQFFTWNSINLLFLYCPIEYVTCCFWRFLSAWKIPNLRLDDARRDPVYMNLHVESRMASWLAKRFWKSRITAQLV